VRECKDAVGFIRSAMGLKDAHPRLAQFIRFAQLPKGLPSDLLVEALEGVSQQGKENSLVITLLKDLKSVPNLRLPAQLQLRLTNQVMRK